MIGCVCFLAFLLYKGNTEAQEGAEFTQGCISLRGWDSRARALLCGLQGEGCWSHCLPLWSPKPSTAQFGGPSYRVSALAGLGLSGFTQRPAKPPHPGSATSSDTGASPDTPNLQEHSASRYQGQPWCKVSHLCKIFALESAKD